MKQVEVLVEVFKEEVKVVVVLVIGLLVDDLIQEIIIFDDFVKVDLRVALIENVEFVEGFDKLLCLILDFGGEKCNVFFGICFVYLDLQVLIGCYIIMVVNLVLCKMCFGIFEGMVMVVGLGGKDIFLLSLDVGVKLGYQVK